MLISNHKISQPDRGMALTLVGLLSILLTGYVLGGCGGVLSVAPSALEQVQTSTPGATDPTPPRIPTPISTFPLPPGPEPTGPRIPPPLSTFPRPEPTGPRIPTPEPTLEPTLPPSSTPRPTRPPSTRTPTPTLATLILLTDPVPQPNPNEQGVGVEWFAATGHTLRGAFLDHWTMNGAAAQFGYPLTEEFVEVTSTDPDNNQLKYQAIQYFEHALFTREAEPPESKEEGSKVQTPTQAQTGAQAQLEATVEAQLGISGIQMLQQNGYATGRYPLFGYASDFSWLSGEMEYHKGGLCMNLGCGCSFLSYDMGKTSAQLAGGKWWSYAGWQVTPNEGERLVVFGHFAHADERDQDRCVMGWPKETRLYIAEHAQMNPTP